MKFQLALDAVELQQAKAIVGKIHRELDIVELGTPFLWRYPLDVIREFKNEFSDVEILADLKIMDGGAYCANMAFDAGADIVTVSALSLDENIKGAVAAAREKNRKVLADLMAVPVDEIAKTALRVEQIGVDYVCIHRGIGIKTSPLAGLKILKETLTTAGDAIAGGIDAVTLGEIAPYNPDLVIMGSVLTGAPNPLAVLTELKEIGRSKERKKQERTEETHGTECR